MKPYLTTAHVAAALAVSEDTVRSYVREGRIPVERTPGGHARYDLDRVHAALALHPRVRRLQPLRPGEIRLGDVEAALSTQGSVLDDLRFSALVADDVVREDSALPNWPGIAGSARVFGQRAAVAV